MPSFPRRVTLRTSLPHHVNSRNIVQSRVHARSKESILQRDKVDERDSDSHIQVDDHIDPCLSKSGTSDNGKKDIVFFALNDPEDPRNWSSKKKAYVVFVGVALVMNSTIGSSIASGASREFSHYFHNVNQEQLVLPISIYLVGYVIGPLVFGPLSESYGRKWVMVATFALFTLFTVACAVAPNFASLIVFRLMVGIGASSPISVVGGIYADVYADPVTRGRALTIFMTATTFGPLFGPIMSGFIAVLSWRWIFWLSLMIAGVTWPVLLFSPETYGPSILKSRAKRLRKETGNKNISAPIELEQNDMKQLITVVLTRPLRMFLFEAIVLCSCLYLALAYAIFYMFFQAYPIIFTGIYGFNAGEVSLTFLPIGIGSVLACAIYLYWDKMLLNAKKRSPPAPWSQKEEYRRLPLACIGGPLFVIALFWMGASARPDVHWIVPTLSALPFGMGFLLLFMALLNYLVDAYEVFAASAAAAAACSRSLLGAVLPFAAKPMYEKLGIKWACWLLAFLSLAMCIIPFAFIRYGDKIRSRSKFCQYLKQKKLEDEERVQSQREMERREDAVTQEEHVPEKMA